MGNTNTTAFSALQFMQNSDQCPTITTGVDEAVEIVAVCTGGSRR